MKFSIGQVRQMRCFAVDRAHVARIFHGGMIDPVVLVDGQAQGRWQVHRRKDRLVVAGEPFAPLAADVDAFVDAEVQDVGRFLGQEVGGAG